jgi:glycosyltransferase involved in cell wall biosynthesis
LPAGDFRLSVVVPAYREERIGATVGRLREALLVVEDEGGVEIVVVDDGSRDGTAELAGAAGADQVVILPENRGKGAAVRAGMLRATGRVVAFTDADLAYSPDQLVGLLHGVESGWDVVVGSREHDDATTVVGASWLRSAGHRVVSMLNRVVLVGRHRDTQCGIKAFRADVARVLFSRAGIDRFAFDVELFHLIERYGFSLSERPVRVENSDRSTVRVARDAVRLVADLARIRRWGRQGRYELDGADLLSAPHRVPMVAETFEPTHLSRSA